MVEVYSDAADYGTKQRKQISNTERELKEAKKQEREYTMEQKLASIRSTQRSRGRPVRTRMRTLGTRGLQEAQETTATTERNISTNGVSKIKGIVSSIFGTPGNGTNRSGLSLICDEVSQDWVDPFHREYFKSGMNPGDRNFFSDENKKERVFFGEKKTDLLVANKNKETLYF